MWEITVEKITDLNLLRRVLSFCYEIDSKMGLRLAYLREHTPIRLQLFAVWMRGIPNKASVHFVRHEKNGQFHLVGSNRADWKGAEDPDEHDRSIHRLTPVNHFMLLNAEHLITMAHKRLCGQAEKPTRMIMWEIREKVQQIDPHLAFHMVPKCAYRGGICTEVQSCGYKDSMFVQAYLEYLRQQP